MTKSPKVSYEEKIKKGTAIYKEAKPYIPDVKNWDKEFDRMFTVIIQYEKWSDEEYAQKLSEPKKRWLDIPREYPDFIKDYIKQLVAQVRKDTLEAVERGLPKKSSLFGSRIITTKKQIGYNQAIDEVLSLILGMKGGKE